MEDACYPKDLFVDEASRGHRVARALIERVVQSARENNASRFYWYTRQDNITARLLFDKVVPK
jgi:GNAT superfamily N-acetyltransferase